MSDGGWNLRIQRVNERWFRLLRLAKERDVLVVRRDVDGVDPRSWEGFWRNDPDYGAALLINPALPELQAQWVCAHELGHDVTNREYLLFPASEVMGAVSRKRTPGSKWQKPKRVSNPEEVASEWAVRQLVSEWEFKCAEALYPCSLPAMASHLALHLEVLLVASLVYGNGAATGTVRVSQATLADLNKPNRPAGGGHQGLLGSLQNGLKGDHLTLTRSTFNRLRAYNRSAGGGFGGRYQNVLADLSRSFNECGGIHFFFRPDGDGPGRQHKSKHHFGEQLQML